MHVSDRYEARLGLMEDWYRRLIHLEEREALLLHDYAPHESYLRGLRGRVLDVGGGAGIAARFLDPEVSYVVVDPSAVWDAPEWVEFGREFRGSGPEPQFIKGTGERLPFSNGEFDAVLSFWSLNHAHDPPTCIAEIARVLKAGGSARLVVDDVEPNWSDLLVDGANRVWARFSGRPYETRIQAPLRSALQMKLRGRWKIHEDHVPISQRDLEDWISVAAAVQRHQWLDGSLTLDAVRR